MENKYGDEQVSNRNQLRPDCEVQWGHWNAPNDGGIPLSVPPSFFPFLPPFLPPSVPFLSSSSFLFILLYLVSGLFKILVLNLISFPKWPFECARTWIFVLKNFWYNITLKLLKAKTLDLFLKFFFLYLHSFLSFIASFFKFCLESTLIFLYLLTPISKYHHCLTFLIPTGAPLIYLYTVYAQFKVDFLKMLFESHYFLHKTPFSNSVLSLV